MVLIRYLGGKSKISKQISNVINELIGDNTPFISLFCGTCSVESKINTDIKILNDKHTYLIEMLKGLQQGYILPDSISREEYMHIKDNLDDDKVLSGFVGFGCSFGGKWFGGYAKSSEGRNYCAESKRSIMKYMENLQTATFLNLDYKDVKIPNGSVVYCDPPYHNTTDYGSDLKFDTNEFWDYIREISKSNMVFVSEQVAPDDFECVWQKEFTRTLDVNKNNQPKRVEKLFAYYN